MRAVNLRCALPHCSCRGFCERVLPLPPRYPDRNGAECAYCGIVMRHGSKLWESPTTDHIHPLSRGGSNDRENRCLACEYCNKLKDNLLLEEWVVNLEDMGDQHRADRVRQFIAERTTLEAAE